MPATNDLRPETLRYGNFDVRCDADGKPRMLGKGTFGSTYLAQHRFLETLAALKVINERFAAEPTARERFLREARAVARLDHRNIARVQDFGEAGSALFYAMEYCAGGNLSERVTKSGALSVADWLLVAQQVASGLKCCHAAGFIHRDLKPSNLMLAQAEGPFVVKLIDFGLVHAERRAPADAHVTGAQFFGTPLYASPEQLREETIGPQSDLFSLGMSLWHLAAGAVPESGSSASIVARRLSHESYAGRLPERLPPRLREILGLLVEKAAADRPSSAAELLAMLDDAARVLGLPISSEVMSRAEESAISLGPEIREALAEAEPIELVEVAAPLESEFHVLATAAEQNTGINYLAEPIGQTGGRVWLHSIHPQLVENEKLLGSLRGMAGRLRRLGVPHVLTAQSVRAFQNHIVMIVQAPRGVPLLDELKRLGKLSLADARPLLSSIAAASDRLAAAGLPGVELSAGAIYVPEGAGGPDGPPLEPELAPRFLAARETAAMTESLPADDATATMTPDFLGAATAGENEAAPFARLIYRIAAGRDCPAAASLSIHGYVAVSGLSEDSNRLLSQVISHTSGPVTCEALLTDLLTAEGMGSGGRRSGSGSSIIGSAVKTSARIATEPQRSAPLAAAAERPPATGASQPLSAPPPPPPVAPERKPLPVPPARRPVPEKPEPRGKGMLIAAALLVLAVVAGTAFFFRPKPDASGTSAATGTSSGSSTSAPTGEVLPSSAAFRFVGDLPEHAEFTVGGAKVKARRTGSTWEVPLGGARTPVEVAFHARGYASAPKQIASAADLGEPLPVELKRATGKVVFKFRGPSDYSNVHLKMLETLPDDAGLVPVSRVAHGSGLTMPETRLNLPTGKYLVILQSGNGSIVKTRELARIEVREGAEVICPLPVSYVGKYAGEAGGSPVELTIESSLDGGELVDQAGGTTRRVRLEQGRVNPAGAFTAVAKFSEAHSPAGYDEQIVARLSDDGSVIEITTTESAQPNRAIEEIVGRPPRSQSEWSRTGTLRRAGR